ncbi:Hypothetical protein BSPT1_I1998 [Brucella suis bv. 2]|nr:Hypothetical protein BSPT1_I1998 [Brucella suis bv. 2]
MQAVLGALVMKPARQTLRILRLNAKRAGHAEMADDRKPVIEMDGQIFRTAAKRLDAPAGKAFGKIFRKGKAQVGPILLHPHNGCPFHEGLQTTANRFDLWQFRHRVSFRSKG